MTVSKMTAEQRQVALAAYQAAAEHPALAGTNTLIEGPTGTGKTHCFSTLEGCMVDGQQVDLFYVAMENGLESLVGAWADRGKPVPDWVHWHVLKAPDTGLDELQDIAKKVNTFSFKMLSDMVDANRGKYNQFISLYELLNDFVDQRTGVHYGPVNEWCCAIDPDGLLPPIPQHVNRVLAIDGLSGINRAAMVLMTGGRPARNQADWGVAQQQIENLLLKLCDGCFMHFAMTAHVERESDPVTGQTKVMTSTLGKALAPKIPSMFSDVILSRYDGQKWVWDTADPTVDLKTRNVPRGQSSLAPSFAQIFKKWGARAGAM